jgi:ATP/maltotriose-dependent transcriptional regulator MalT
MPSALAALAARLTVVHAPAGFGKTTAVRGALHGDAASAWLDAEPWDRDQPVAALIAAIRAVRPDAGRVTLAMAATDASPERLGASLAAELAYIDAPLRIVVDDAHRLGPHFAEFIGALARRAPDNVRIVLLTREPLDVGLPEAVAQGRGALVDADMLRFTADDIKGLAAALNAPLDDAAANDLRERTGGWPIAVTLALRDRSGALLDELLARAVAALAPDDARLLRDTIVFERLEPALLVEPGAVARLDALARDGVLVTRVQDGYRVQPAVRDVLLRAIPSDALPTRHQLAAETFASSGRLAPALFHWGRALELAPTDQQRASVGYELQKFLAVHAAHAHASGLGEGVRGLLTRLPAIDPALSALVEGLRAKARGDDGRAAFATAERAAAGSDNDAIVFESRLQAVEADLARGDAVDAARIDDLMTRASRRGPQAIAGAAIRGAWALAIEGRFAAALARVDDLPHDDPALQSEIAPLLAYCYIALGEFEAAERVTAASLDALAAGDDLARYAGALGWAARFALLRGETTAAYDFARESERIARPFALRANAAAIAATTAEAALHTAALDDAERAAAAAARGADAAWYARDAQRARTIAAQVTARVQALRGQHTAALAALDATDPLALADAAVFAALAKSGDAADRAARARRAIAAALPYDGADAVALWSAADLVDLIDAVAGRAETTRLRANAFDGLIARRAEPLRLVALVPAARGDAAAFATALALAERNGPRYEVAIARRLLDIPQPRGGEAALLEPLTERETEILELLAAGLTNREIAQRLIVSPRTVESHVARLTGKLGVNTRARAVARANALGLVTIVP